MIDDNGEIAAASIAEQKEKLEQERAKRRAVIEEKLASLSVVELLHCVMNSQEQRVVTYRAFDSYVLLVYCSLLTMHLRLLWMLLSALLIITFLLFFPQRPRGGSEKWQPVPLSQRLR